MQVKDFEMIDMDRIYTLLLVSNNNNIQYTVYYSKANSEGQVGSRCQYIVTIIFAVTVTVTSSS